MDTNNKPSTGTWVDTKKAAEHLGIHRDSLRRFRRVGGGPPFTRIGRSVRYRLEDIDAWMRSRMAKSTAEEVARGPRGT
jgi:excisionase family DNA binding protein